ncbi:MAG TPA: hypothetical protein VKT99_01095 [Xanthobacteraceae bacterium]|jgi:hypothetical protein|nr:hypothetical protein [Xanthobacteraceae bacterium]
MRVRSSKGLFLAFALTFLVASCASSQINYNTLEIASTYDQLITKQVAYNLMKVYDDPYGLPALVKVTAQTTTAQNSITPSLSYPVTAQLTQLAQLTQATTIQNVSSVTKQRAGSGLSIAATDQWNSTYTLTPVTDADQLRRLRTLYQYVTRTGALSENIENPDQEFEALYPLIETGTSNGGTQSANETSLLVTANGISFKQGSPQSKEKTKYVRRSFKSSPDGTYTSFNGYTWVLANPDKTFIKQPGCILCDLGRTLQKQEVIDICKEIEKGETISKKARILTKEEFEKIDRDCQKVDENKKYADYKDAHKLEKNGDLRNDWLYRPDEPVGSDAVALPSNGTHNIYLKKNVNADPDGGRKYFYEFALLTEDASAQGTGSPASGGQSQGRKTPNLIRVSVPVGGALPSP